jgi:hypothetical protein
MYVCWCGDFIFCVVSIHRSLLQVIRHIYVEDGITGYWRGLTSTWAREIPGYFSFFLTYEAAKKTLARPTQSVDELGEIEMHSQHITINSV